MVQGCIYRRHIGSHIARYRADERSNYENVSLLICLLSADAIKR